MIIHYTTLLKVKNVKIKKSNKFIQEAFKTINLPSVAVHTKHSILLFQEHLPENYLGHLELLHMMTKPT